MDSASPSKQQIVASSSIWVAALLNLVPGLGSGYLYQRRWRAYWITATVSTAWFVAGALAARGLEAQPQLDRLQQNQLVGLLGLLLLAVVTAVEASLAVQRARRS
jgi:hypothetical protein